MMRGCLLLAAAGCSDERTPQTKKQERQIRALRHQNETLHRQIQTLRNGLLRLSTRIPDLNDEQAIEQYEKSRGNGAAWSANCSNDWKDYAR